jgi:hypothetical protein
LDRPPAKMRGDWTAGEEHQWRDAAMKITNETLEGYLNCKTGAIQFFRFTGRSPWRS